MVRRTTWEVRPGETGFEYLERLVGQTELQGEFVECETLRELFDETLLTPIITAYNGDSGT